MSTENNEYPEYESDNTSKDNIILNIIIMWIARYDFRLVTFKTKQVTVNFFLHFLIGFGEDILIFS